MRSRKRLLVQIDASSCASPDCLDQIRARVESFIFKNTSHMDHTTWISQLMSVTLDSVCANFFVGIH